MFKEQMPIEDSSKPESGEPSDAEKLTQLEQEKLVIADLMERLVEFTTTGGNEEIDKPKKVLETQDK